MLSIQPFNKTTIQTAVRFSLDISQLILNTSATFRVSLYDAEDQCFENKYVTLEGDDYKNWNNDDQYVINFIAMKLGFVLTI